MDTWKPFKSADQKAGHSDITDYMYMYKHVQLKARYMYMYMYEDLTYRNVLNASNGLHLLHIAHTGLLDPQSTAHMSPAGAWPTEGGLVISTDKMMAPAFQDKHTRV